MEDLRVVTRYDRREHGRGVVSWVYDYWNREPIAHSGLASGLELGVQVRGDWTHEGARSRDRVTEGQAHHLSIGERFAVSFDGAATPGTQVGFAIYPHEDATEASRVGRELRFVDASPRVDARFLGFCRELDAHRDLPSAQIADEAWRYVNGRCELVAKDHVAAGKEELERYFDRELRIEHIAEVAGLHPVNFARKFKARYGLSPVTYRVRWRFHHAARLLWSRLDLSIREVAETCALGDLPYFYRGFNKLFRATPGMYRDRAQARPIT